MTWQSSGGFFEIELKQQEISTIEGKAGAAGFWDNQQEAQKLMQRLNSLKEDVMLFQQLEKEFQETQGLLDMAAQENDETLQQELQPALVKLQKKLDLFIFRTKLSGPFDRNNAIVTLHSGAGGTEACDWVEMLLRMYSRWAESKGFAAEITDILAGEEAGIKSVTFIITGPYAYGYLKSETGVHRLVRISPFDANKRRHTTFASCDVIPEISDEISIDIKESDLRIDTYRSGGHGGQHVNKTESAIRITHLPTNTVVQSQKERSQIKNRATAMKLLRAKLFELEQDKRRKQAEKHYDDKGAIAWGSQIRSYVFCPYTLVKDHRTGVEIGNVQAVMDGEIDPFIEAYLDKQVNK
ncbi:MAG: peptide chain release factor 2 [bacterium]|nr:peptide chain release factor 2 [bacterium]MDD5756457.1 peptide chain release factor 2 [bacterium]